MKLFQFRSQLRLDRTRDEIFDYFSNALNLEQITPPWLHFQVVSQLPIQMCEGTEIEYRLAIRRIPVRWRSRITVWDPPRRFVDEQVHGPYRRWIHEHRFLDAGNATSCEDFVQYATWGGALINKLFVERDIRSIFAYRSERLRQTFEKRAEAASFHNPE